MPMILTIFFVSLAVLALIGHLAEKRVAKGDKNVTPGLSLLPGDIKYESQDGRVKIYFPVVTSIVLSLALSLVLRFFQ